MRASERHVDSRAARQPCPSIPVEVLVVGRMEVLVEVADPTEHLLSQRERRHVAHEVAREGVLINDRVETGQIAWAELDVMVDDQPPGTFGVAFMPKFQLAATPRLWPGLMT